MNTEHNKKAHLRKLIHRLGIQVLLFILLVAVAFAIYALTRGL